MNEWCRHCGRSPVVTGMNCGIGPCQEASLNELLGTSGTTKLKLSRVKDGDQILITDDEGTILFSRRIRGL